MKIQKTPAGVSVSAGPEVRVLRAPSPIYTKAARDANISGTVVLVGTLGVDGCLRNIKIVRSLGYGLDESAIEVLQYWRFQPFQNDGQRTNAQVEGEIGFDRTLSHRKTIPLGTKCGQ